MPKLSIDQWEDEFCQICEEILEEEPLYPYEHLWKKGLSPKEAFKAYLQENPDYAEKIQDSPPSDEKQQQDFLELAKKLEKQKREKEIEEKMSKFCPECARVMGTKNVCKCGYRRPSSKKRDADYY